MVRKRIYSVLVENRSGVLCKVAGLFSRRCFNIDSLAAVNYLKKLINVCNIINLHTFFTPFSFHAPTITHVSALSRGAVHFQRIV